MLLPFAALPEDMVFEAIMPPDIWPFAMVFVFALGQPVSVFALLLIMLLEDMVLLLSAANTALESIRPAARAPAATRLRDRKYMGQSLICGEPADRAA
jgi:hypothetical protein